MDKLFLVFDAVEWTGRWPCSTAEGVIALLIKEDSNYMVNKLRPISVLASMYRVWATLRMQSMTEWVASWAPRCLFGSVKHGDPSDGWMSTAVAIELAQTAPDAAGQKLVGMVLDFVKAHNRLLRIVVFHAATRLGLAPVDQPGMLRAWDSFVRNCRRRFRLAGGLGQGFTSANGFEGDPLACLAMNITAYVIILKLSIADPLLDIEFFADNGVIRAKTFGQLAAAISLLEWLQHILDFEVSATKSWVYGTTQALRSQIRTLLFKGEPIAVKLQGIELGAQLAYARQRRLGNLTIRINKALATLEGISRLPVDLNLKSRWVRSTANRQLAYAIGCCPPSTTDMNMLRSAACKAVYTNGGRYRSQELVLHVLAPAFTDPAMDASWTMLCDVRRFIAKFPARIGQIIDILTEAQNTEGKHGYKGPVINMVEAFKDLKWTFRPSKDDILVDRGEGRVELPLLGSNLAVWKDLFVTDFQQAMWTRVRKKRKAYSDLQDIDVEATQSAVKKLPRDDQGLVRMIQSGARRDVANLVHCGIRKDLRCSCGFEPETLEQMYLDCPDRAASRNVSNQLLAAFRKLPWDTLRHCLVPVDTGIIAARERLFDTVEAPQRTSISVDIKGTTAVKVWGDGSCRPPTCRLTRRSTFAIHSEQYEYVSVIGGWEQSAPRAELMAILAALRLDIGELECIGDCKSMLDLARQRQKVQVTWPPYPLMRNGDLWKLIDERFRVRPKEAKFTWGKGHSSDEGNHRADQLCSAAHSPDPSLAVARTKRGRTIEIASQYFAMVAAITRAEIDEGKQADADDEDHDHGLAYPEHWGGDWTNATPGCIKFTVEDVIEERNKPFVFGMEFFFRLQTYLRQLQWPNFSEKQAATYHGRYCRLHGITEKENLLTQVSWIELAADYEISTGTRLPVALEGRRKTASDRVQYRSQEHNKQYELPDISDKASVADQSLAEKGRIFQSAVQSVEAKLKDRVTCGEAVKVSTLRALGFARPVPGLSTRPRLLCGGAVKRVLLNYFWVQANQSNMQGSISFLGHGAPVLDLPSRKGASDPTSGLKLCELPKDAILNARSRERGLHVVVYVEGTTRGSSQPLPLVQEEDHF